MGDPTMRSGNKNTFVIACGVAIVLAGSLLWFYVKHSAQGERLKTYLGLSAKEVLQDMHLADAEWGWVDEPPCVLRGVCYNPGKGTSVTLYIDQREPLYRKFDEKRKWDYNSFLACRVGGIQYDSHGAHFDVGADVPWQFRRP